MCVPQQAVLGEMVELLGEYQDELLVLGDFDEAFDVLGVLAEVLREAPSCDAFVEAARS